jgi:hypothetical protein
MPQPDSIAPIDTRCFGIATDFNTPRPEGLSRKLGLYEIKFDTGVVLYVPPMMFDGMVFDVGYKDG